MSHPIEQFLGSIHSFLDQIFESLGCDNIDVSSYELDHICYRVETEERYSEMKEKLETFWEMLSEVLVGGRMIATFHLHRPIVYCGRRIYCIELPSPKTGSPYREWFEHAEFVIDRGLDEFVRLYPEIVFDMSSIWKSINPDISRKYDMVSVKFHQNTLEYVVKYLQG